MSGRRSVAGESLAAEARTEQPVQVAVRFTVQHDGMIEARVGPDGGLVTLALNDAVGSRAPRGVVHQGLSTFWIDRAESGVRLAIDQRRTEPFASGNVTYVRLDGDRIVAAFDFDAEEQDVESLPVGDFLALLDEWRRRIGEAGGASGTDAALPSEPPPPRSMGPAT